jgi:hypothetical protein
MQKSFVLDPPDKEATVVSSFTMREYHEICTRNLAQYRNISFPISGYKAVKLGAVISFSSTPLTGEHILALEDPVEILLAKCDGLYSDGIYRSLADFRRSGGSRHGGPLDPVSLILCFFR